MKKIKVAILGSGNIGTDLLVKIMRSPVLECSMFIGRNLSSSGMKKAASLGIPISDRSIDAIVENPDCCDIVFDATSAAHHLKHAPILKELGKITIDMTPSQVGKMCVPSINLDECLREDNINMITCGGQTSIPIAYAMSRNQNVKYIEVVSSIASRSAGPGTRANIDEYIQNTEAGLAHFTGCKNVKAIIGLNPAQPCIDMQTSICALIDNPDIELITKQVDDMVENMKRYVPGYSLLVEPVIENGRVYIMVKVAGLGDYLPAYAGNLDIINCAAVAMAEKYAVERQGV